MLEPIRYKDGKLIIIDQTLLPVEYREIEIQTLEEAYDAIKTLQVRGAPAIGVFAAYAILVYAMTLDEEEFHVKFKKASKKLAESRPTAVNLFWALERMERTLVRHKEEPLEEILNALEQEAVSIHQEDIDTCRRIGLHGAELLKDGQTILTHCNAGILATSKYGTALSPVYIAKEQGKEIKVYADETRPLLQGSRLTTFELMREGIDVTLIADNMAGLVMREGKIDAVIVGCDRVAANGDTANKIGTYSVAVLAKAHHIPFYIAGPKSTFDLGCGSGDEIPIEERDSREIICGMGAQTAPMDVKVYNPAFDVTPHELIDGFITEEGILRPPFTESIRNLFNKERK